MTKLSAHPEGNPEYAKPVRIVDGYKDRLSKKAALVATTSTSLATILGESIASDDIGVRIISDGTVQYNPTGTADTNSGFIPTDFFVYGGKDFLDNVRLYAAGTPVVSVIVFSVHGA